MMLTMKKICFVAFAIIICSSCQDEIIIQEFEDGFYTINSYWSTSETNSSDNFKIVDDPVNKDNKALQFRLFPEDYNSNGKRNEFILKTKDTIGLKVEYSFDFLFHPEFFKKKEKDWIMIHQWHDRPPKGVSWKNYKMFTRPPIHLYIQLYPSGVHHLVYAYGLKNKEMSKIKHIKIEKPLEPNQWYTFENTVFWETSNRAYSVPKINDEYFINAEVDVEHKIYGANMFNNVPNYFKMGLYGNNKSQDTVSVLIDNFKYKLKK